MTTPNHIASLPGSARLDELKRLARRLRLLDPDLALTLGINRETVRLYLCGKSSIPNSVLITLAALDTLPREAAEAFVVRAPRKESIADIRAARRLAETAHALAAESEFEALLAARPPLSAFRAGAAR